MTPVSLLPTPLCVTTFLLHVGHGLLSYHWLWSHLQTTCSTAFVCCVRKRGRCSRLPFTISHLQLYDCFANVLLMILLINIQTLILSQSVFYCRKHRHGISSMWGLLNEEEEEELSQVSLLITWDVMALDSVTSSLSMTLSVETLGARYVFFCFLSFPVTLKTNHGYYTQV